MIRWVRPNWALFSTFFAFLVGIGPELVLFDPLFGPYACRCDDASAGAFPPFPSALLHASVGPRLPKWQWKAGDETAQPSTQRTLRTQRGVGGRKCRMQNERRTRRRPGAPGLCRGKQDGGEALDLELPSTRRGKSRTGGRKSEKRKQCGVPRIPGKSRMPPFPPAGRGRSRERGDKFYVTGITGIKYCVPELS